MDMTDAQKINIINSAIKEYFESTINSFCKPKDLMSILIRKGLFINDHRKGLPLRKLLRHWDDILYLKDYIPAIRIERKKKYRYWYFDRTE